jgi:hypothetical protein
VLPSGFAIHVLALTKPPSMSRGRALRHERGEGSARLIPDDCLKYLFNLKKVQKMKYIAGI